MIITCPACSTRYSIDAVHLGTGGRLMRCSACGEQWHAHAEPVRGFAALPAAMAMTAAAAVAAAPPPPPPPPPPPRPRVEPAPPPPPRPAPPVEDVIVPAAVYEEDEEEEEAPKNPLSQEELDAMFAEPAPVESLVDEEEDDSEPVDEFEDLPEPEPIPNVFTDPSSIPDDEDERSGSALMVVLVALLVVAGIIGGLYFARQGVMAMVPASRAVYNLVGLGGERLGAGLEIRNVVSERETENNTDVLVVRGTITNVDKQHRAIPLIRVVLYDGGSHALQDMVMPPLKPELDAGEDIGFRARLVDPSPLARRIEVTFAEAPAQPES